MHNLPHSLSNSSNNGKSFGEIAFDSAVYGGIGYIGNAALSLAISHQAINLPQSKLAQSSNKSRVLFEDVMKTVTENPEHIKSWANRANDIFYLGSGGWLLLVPMKWMEDNKLSLVQTIDRAFGTGPKSEADRNAQADRLQSSAKQTYLSLFSGRAITYPVIVSAAVPVMTTLKGNEYLNEVIEKHAGHLFEQFKNPKKLIDLTSQEIILAGTGAALLYGLSKTVANIQHKVEKQPSPSNSVESPVRQGMVSTQQPAVAHPI